MNFGPVAVSDSVGAILAHTVRTVGGTIRKGTMLTAGHVAEMEAARLTEVVVARLEDGDVHEDKAAAEVATAVSGGNVRMEAAFTGRSNLFAKVAGVVRVDRGLVDGLNRVDPAITLATVPDFTAVSAGQMVATVKIIPFAVPQALLAAAPASPAIRIAAFVPRAVGLVATMLPSLKPSVMDKTRRLLDARLEPSGSTIVAEERVPHEVGAVATALEAQAAAGAKLLIAFGASAVSDAGDVIPAAIVAAGGRVVRLGMPVDPGNLLVLGEIGSVPVIGAPGCARSPKQNGFDWVLNRILADIPVTGDDIAGLGVGGLLTEIASRPQPRQAVKVPRIAAVLLAAGSSRRMGGVNKLLARIGDKPLVRIAAEAALGSHVGSLVVVTGHERERIEAALAGLNGVFVHNPHHALGMSTSLRAGVAGLPGDIDGAIVLLADMPEVSSATIDRVVASFGPDRIVVPTSGGRRGNPVLWPRRFFGELAAIEGDQGGRRVIDAHPDAVVEIELGNAAGHDVDTPEALADIGGAPA